MRRQQHRSSWASLFASKRIVVALCAAIAMVLGAMSVGAYTPKPVDPTEDYPLPAANQTTIVSQEISEQRASRQVTEEFAMHRQTAPLAPEKDQATEQTRATNGLPSLSLSVSVGFAEAGIVISSQAPLLGEEIVVPAISSEPEPSLPEEQPQTDTPSSTPQDSLTTFAPTENPSGTVIQ